MKRPFVTKTRFRPLGALEKEKEAAGREEEEEKEEEPVEANEEATGNIEKYDKGTKNVIWDRVMRGARERWAGVGGGAKTK